VRRAIPKALSHLRNRETQPEVRAGLLPKVGRY